MRDHPETRRLVNAFFDTLRFVDREDGSASEAIAFSEGREVDPQSRSPISASENLP